MKMSRLVSIVLLGTALAIVPVYAQRGGGGGRSGGGGGGVSSSRGGGGAGGGFSSSRSSSSYSSSRSSSSYSSPSRSSSSSYSSSRSSSSYSSPSRSSSSSSDYRSSSPSSSYRSSSSNDYRPASVPSMARARSSQSSHTGDYRQANGGARSNGGVRNGQPVTGNSRGNATAGRPGGVAPTPAGGYARPGHPNGPMPNSMHPMHPAPYFHHPYHHHMVHCHLLYWDPFPPRPYYWPGFWYYCNGYWYDYHVTDMVVVKQYVRDTYSMDLITYAMSGDYMYALVNDPDGHTYLQIYDQNDKLLAEQQVSRKYCQMQIDSENGGCWIMKKRGKDPLLFFYTPEGQLLIYEADK